MPGQACARQARYSSAVTAFTKLAVVPEPPMSGVLMDAGASFSTAITARSSLAQGTAGLTRCASRALLWQAISLRLSQGLQ
jgi:hypothetical protein